MKHTKDSLLSTIKSFYEKHKRIPTAHETIQLPDFPRYKIFEYHFGSWSNALKLAGFDVTGKIYPDKIHTQCSQCGGNISIYQGIFNKSKTKRFFCSRSCSTSYNNTHKKYGTRRSKFEQYVQEQLTIDFPNLEILYNQKDVIQSELDIYIPSLKLAIELNGIVHYEPIYGADKLTKIQDNDRQKAIRCYEVGIEFATIDISKCSQTKQYPTYYNLICNLLKSILTDFSNFADLGHNQ
ncbi:MAG: hypothetical protein CTY12_01195 [Methylotenera sp.]|nr:MAG: hypothetical protein CTY12_01195 [Methylotenera sp.]